MSTAESESARAVWRCLADPTRRALLERITDSPGITTGELRSSAPGLTRWAVMKHLAILRAAGLLHTMAEGRHRRHYPDLAGLEPLRTWLLPRP
jgi:DNA-binding transcriptional ArsR family regulator